MDPWLAKDENNNNCPACSLRAYLSVGPLALRVDCAVAIRVLAGGLRLRRVPLEGTAELETLVLRGHGDAESREALGVQVGLHTRRHAVGALETSPPGSRSRGPGAIGVTQSVACNKQDSVSLASNYCTFLLKQDSHAVAGVSAAPSAVISFA